MEYKTHKRTKNLTLRDIHVGDLVQVWSEQTERYSPPLKITQICDDGTVYLIIDDENRLDPWEENIKDIDGIPITIDILKGFGITISDVYYDCGEICQNAMLDGKKIGQIRCNERGIYIRVWGGEFKYLHEIVDYWHRNHVDIKLEWKGV